MPKGIYKHSKNSGFQKGHGSFWDDKVKEKIRLIRTGKHWKCSDKAKENMSRGRKKFYKKGGVHPLLGKKRTDECKKKIRLALKGLRLSEENRLKRRETSPSGKDHYKWKGGLSSENKKIRDSIETRLWREAVFSRDNWTCQKYKTRGCKLVAHHIKNFAEYKNLRFAIDNGITLSSKAHVEFHKKYGFKNNTEEQLNEFITN